MKISKNLNIKNKNPLVAFICVVCALFVTNTAFAQEVGTVTCSNAAIYGSNKPCTTVVKVSRKKMVCPSNRQGNRTTYGTGACATITTPSNTQNESYFVRNGEKLFNSPGGCDKTRYTCVSHFD